MIGYRREIDGLRAVAVAPVIFFHAGFSAFRGGFVGVDVFFVISGYLITSLIASEIEAGSFSLVKFYERRARRILPALFVVIAACLPFAWFLLLPGEMKDFSQSVAAVSVFASNILFWRESNYFDTPADLKPLLHTWSLAVEEQYYVLFPLFLLLVWRFGKGRLVALVAAIGVISLLIAQWGAYEAPVATFYLLPTRAWELAIGALTAFYLAQPGAFAPGDLMRQALSGVGLLLIAFAVFAFDQTTPFPSFYALVPTIGAALIILFATPTTATGRLLSSAPLVGVGLISYSAYLWHQPLFAFARQFFDGSPSDAVFIALSGCALLMAWLSWQYVERPFRAPGGFTRSEIFSYALVGTIAFCLLAAYAGRDGLPRRFAAVSAAFPNFDVDNKELRVQSWGLLRRLSKDQAYGVENNDFDLRPWFSDQAGSKKILIVGNSHSKDLFNALWLNHDSFQGLEFARFGVQINCLDAQRRNPLYAAPNYRAADVIIVSTRWHFGQSCRGGAGDDFDGLANLIRVAKQDGKTVAIASNTLEFPKHGSTTIADRVVLNAFRVSSIDAIEERRESLIDAVNRAYFETRDQSIEVNEINARLRAIATANDLPYLDKAKFLCDEVAHRCLGLTEQFEKAFFDGGHYTLAGAREFGKAAYGVGWLKPIDRAKP